MTFPLLSDFNHTVSKQYGILNTQHGFAKRTTFVIDREGIIHHIDQGTHAMDPARVQQVCGRLAAHSE